jgi:hypothetical protein
MGNIGDQIFFKKTGICSIATTKEKKFQVMPLFGRSVAWKTYWPYPKRWVNHNSVYRCRNQIELNRKCMQITNIVYIPNSFQDQPA